ncbi:MAG TPA: hypothetical protein VFA56_07820 [Gaiellaceae bacterium]|nr:hypothetical protein [Gaiellaceae bacterium]
MRRAAWIVLAVTLAGCAGTTTSTQATPKPLPPAPRLDPHAAAVAYARCMRAHGIPHPDPDANGDFRLTPAEERKMRAAATPKEHEAADAACFRHLKGTVSTQPLSAGAKRAALVPLRELKRCLHAAGYEVGKPIVKNLSRGRAMFGFDDAGGRPAGAAARQRRYRAQIACEKKVRLAQRIDEIIKIDRGENR